MRANAQRANVVEFSVAGVSFETQTLDWQGYAHYGAHRKSSNTYGDGVYIAEAIGDEKICLPFKNGPAFFPKPTTSYLFSSPPTVFCA